jgi:hypothetical protein
MSGGGVVIPIDGIYEISAMFTSAHPITLMSGWGIPATSIHIGSTVIVFPTNYTGISGSDVSFTCKTAPTNIPAGTLIRVFVSAASDPTEFKIYSNSSKTYFMVKRIA